MVTIREGDGEATGNGQTYRIHAGRRATFNGTESLNADVEQIGDPDQFDNWAYNRDNRYEHSRSAQYVSNDMVGYDDLDNNGDWRDDSSYGHVWFPHVEVGWAPYREGHWDWIDPWGYTWIDDSSWGYAPFHYGRWVSVGDRWGWVAGPREERAVYAPALVVFVGGGGFGGNVGWFPLGPREVYVPSYPVSREYVNRVNISNTTVNTTTITNVYNTTVINKSTTNVTNVTYVNRNVQGAVTAVPQRAFASAQPVARSAVKMDARAIASAPVTPRVAVNPTRESVLGARASTANHVTAPPPAVMNRQVIAKKAPPPPPAPFAERQQAMAAHPGQPLPKREVATLRPAPAAEAHPMVKVAPPGKTLPRRLLDILTISPTISLQFQIMLRDRDNPLLALPEINLRIVREISPRQTSAPVPTTSRTITPGNPAISRDSLIVLLSRASLPIAPDSQTRLNPAIVLRKRTNRITDRDNRTTVPRKRTNQIIGQDDQTTVPQETDQ